MGARVGVGDGERLGGVIVTEGVGVYPVGVGVV